MEDLMLKSIRDNLSYKCWSLYLVVGSIMVCIGILYLMIPNSNSKFKELVYFCIGGFLIHDICDLIFSRSNKFIIAGWWWQSLKAVMGILIDVLIAYLLINSLDQEVMYFTGFWLLLHSVSLIGELYDLKSKVPNGLMLPVAASVVAIILSTVCLISVVCSSCMSCLFILFLIYGVVKVRLGFRYRIWNREVENSPV